MALGVAGEQASGGGESAVMTDRGESITKLASFGGGVADTVSGEQRKMERAGNVDCGAVAGFFFALEMALQFDVDVAGAEDGYELINLAASFIEAASLQGGCEWAFGTAGEADETMGVFFEFFLADGTFAFLGAQLHFGNQAAEVLVAGAGGDQEGETEWIVIPFDLVIPTPNTIVIPSEARNPYPLHGLMGVGVLRLRECFTS